MMRHLNSLFEMTRQDILDILELAMKLKQMDQAGNRPALCAGRVMVQLFEKPSLRTRLSFDAAMMQLGGSSIFLSNAEAGLNGRESLADVARVISGYSDVVVLRTFSQSLIDDFIEVSRCPVINGLSDDRHPCQALTDLFTIREVGGDMPGRRLVFVGDANNVATSLTVAACYFDIPVTCCCPEDYQFDSAFLDQLRAEFPKADVDLVSDPQQAVRDAGIVYTDVWASMGQEAEAEKRKQVFRPYQVNSKLLSHAPDDCKFMHCLPAKRGVEVTHEVMDGPQSIAFLQAENRMHLAKGLIAWLLELPVD